jgi:hypothetical protein
MMEQINREPTLFYVHLFTLYIMKERKIIIKMIKISVKVQEKQYRK